MERPLLAVIVGSNRRESINRKLAQAMIRLGADKFDARLVRIDDLPMFNQDNEGTLPAEVVRFKDELARADGILIVTPEHDRSIPAVLKNAVDWGARPWGKNSWAGKPGFITGTSPGAIGTALAQQHLRSVMTGLGMILLGGEAYITFKPTWSTSTATSATRARGSSCRASSINSRSWSGGSPRYRRARRPNQLFRHGRGVSEACLEGRRPRSRGILHLVGQCPNRPPRERRGPPCYLSGPCAGCWRRIRALPPRYGYQLRPGHPSGLPRRACSQP